MSSQKQLRGGATGLSKPYRFAEQGVALGIEGFHFGESDDTVSPDYDERVVPLDEYQPWDTAVVAATLDVDEPDLRWVFPDDEGPPYPAKLVVSIDCEATQLHYERVVAGPEESYGGDGFELEFDVDCFRGDVTVRPYVVRTEPCSEGLPFAPSEGMQVATGEPWTVRVDDPSKNGSGFPTEYHDFSREGFPPEDLVHALNSNPGDPTAMVNDRHDPIVDVLETGGYGYFKSRAREVVRGEIAMMTWIQLTLHTAGTIAHAGEPEYDWQEGVVKEFGDLLFDEDLSYEETVDRLGEQVSDPTNLGPFARRLNEAAQLYVEHHDRLNKLVEGET